MDHSIFMDKDAKPTSKALKNALGSSFDNWRELGIFTKKHYPNATEEWSFSGAKYGWSFRISDGRRVLVYLLPRDKFFKVSMVFGQKATDAILKSTIGNVVKDEIRNAKVYAEGRGIRIEVTENSVLPDIKELILIKISN